MKERLNLNKISYLSDAKINWQLHIMFALPLLYLIIFKYVPMWGAQIAFRDIMALDGIWGSSWVGLENFHRFFEHKTIFTRIVKNTFVISAYSILAGFPVPIIIALSLNNVESQHFKKTVQLTTYAPHFISTVVMAGIIIRFLDPNTGIVNHIIRTIGFDSVAFMSKKNFFIPFMSFQEFGRMRVGGR